MSLINELKSEVARLARKEIKKEIDPVKRVNAAQRGLIANLRRDVSELQKEVARLKREQGKDTPAGTQEEQPSKTWIMGKGVISMRKRLGLTQTEFAKLAGVSIPTVVKWEKTEGKIPFRQQKTVARLQEIRGMSKKQVTKELGGE